MYQSMILPHSPKKPARASATVVVVQKREIVRNRSVPESASCLKNCAYAVYVRTCVNRQYILSKSIPNVKRVFDESNLLVNEVEA